MKNSLVTSFDELPLFLNAKNISDVLGISLSKSYEIFRRDDFPCITLGKRSVISKEKFIEWTEQQSKLK
jgi:predicted DNA-binding transcriptional regulator AlpA